jgi:hypothetical protein
MAKADTNANTNEWWFAGEDMPTGFSKLRDLTMAGGDDRFDEAQKFTILVHGLWVREKRDLTSGNDLVVVTKHQMGDRPSVDKLHFYQTNVSPNRYEGSFFHPVVYATQDYRTTDSKITLEVGVYDEDGLSGAEATALQAAIQGASTAAAIAFPVFAPYAGLAAGVASATVQLINNLNQHDRIIRSRIDLDFNKPAHRGYKLFQTGFFVCFAQPVDATDLWLGSTGKIYTQASHAQHWVEYKETSYIVLRVVRDFLQSPDYVIDEKAATLMSELTGKRDRTANSLNFLRDTLNAYNSYRRLQRYVELKSKTELSENERALLAELEKDPGLRPYLPVLLTDASVARLAPKR